MSAPLPDVNRAYHLRRPVPGEIVASCSLPGVEPLVLVKLWERLAPAKNQFFAVEMAAVWLARPDAMGDAGEAA